MLYRFRKAMQSEATGWINPTPNEPLLPSTCHSLQGALHARKELYKDISRKISRIHDPELDEPALRSLNDDINRQIRKTREWDECLLRLGYAERDRTVKWGDEMRPEPGNVHGYFYFGRAKGLPGVQELLNPRRAEPTKLPPRITQMQQNADDEYFGVLLPEQEEALQRAEREAELQLIMADAPLLDWLTGVPVHLPPIIDPVDEQQQASSLPTIPTQAQVEEYLIERRRAELLSKYAGGEGATDDL